MDGYEPAEAVGHRVVHGGDRFVEPTLIDDDVIAGIDALSPLAPLHNVPALAAIRDARAALPDVPHVAVFDTAFHASIPEQAATYAVPVRWREDWGVRRYGFHGIAVEWVSSQVAASRLVACHLGGGCSVTAVRDGRSVDTTMGFSPLEGVPMATRSGTIDPAIPFYLVREHGLSLEEVDRQLEHESGLAALGGLDDDLGFAVFTYRTAVAVAQMSMALGGIDVLAFSGGVGENRARRARRDRRAAPFPRRLRRGSRAGARRARHRPRRSRAARRLSLRETHIESAGSPRGRRVGLLLALAQAH